MTIAATSGFDSATTARIAMKYATWRYRPDKTATHVASWTAPPGPTVCVPAGSAHELTATLAGRDRPLVGEVARVTVWLQSGPCGSEADADRIAIAGVQVADDGITLWRPAALDSLPGRSALRRRSGR